MKDWLGMVKVPKTQGVPTTLNKSHFIKRTAFKQTGLHTPWKRVGHV